MNLYEQILNQPHALIAGATGAGKSVAERGIIETMLLTRPDALFLLVDPKRIELREYAKYPGCVGYANTIDGAAILLGWAVEEMERRFKWMERYECRELNGPHVYIFIDELTDLMTRGKREIEPPLETLLTLARAARMHIVALTQRPTSDILSGLIRNNIVARLALRTECAQDSRNVVRVAGAEKLPRHGWGIYRDADIYEPERVRVPLMDEGARLRAMYAGKMRRAIPIID